MALFRLLVEAGPQPGQAFDLLGSEIVVGRDPSCDIVIAAAGVSRRHAAITITGNIVSIQDLNSSNGTWLQEQKIQSRQSILPGDVLSLGKNVHLRLERVDLPPDHSAPEIYTTDLESASTRQAGPDDLPRLQPSLLEVTLADGSSQIYSLTQARITLGRADDNDIVLHSRVVSRKLAVLERVPGGYLLEMQPDAANPIRLRGQPLDAPYLLQPGDKLSVGSQEVTMRYLAPAPAEEAFPPELILLQDQGQITFGRDRRNTIILDSPLVSRQHARLERVGTRLRLVDLNSANGTFVNHQRIDQEAWLQPGDIIGVGPIRLLVDQDSLTRQDRPGGIQVHALGLNKWVRKDLNLLRDISLVFQPGEFIAVVGQSGGGKSTLLDAIAGYRPASDGQVYYNGIDVYRNFEAVRSEIGYVPQRDIIHTELTVYAALDYAAQLRMPPDTSPEERRQRVIQVLSDLDLLHRKDVQISELSGGQQKRVSIGVELLTSPKLFFLDEPTSGLDPGTETALMQLMRRLADGGRTIVLVTHATKNIMLADQVIFLARGGYLAWFGPPEKALDYFQEYRHLAIGLSPRMAFDEIFTLLDDPASGDAEEWSRRYRASPSYTKYISELLDHSGNAAQTPRREKASSARHSRRWRWPDWRARLHQFGILSSRNLKILTRDRFSLALMLAVAPLVGLLDVIISQLLGRNLFDYQTGSIFNATTSLFLLSVYGVLVGGLAFMREFVKEADIYRRERLINLKILPYVLSKMWVVLLLALYHSAAYLLMHYLAFEMPGGLLEFAQIYLSLTLATMGGMMLGLFASSLAPNANAAPMIVILFMLPQIVLAGALINVPSYVSAPTSTRWAYEAFLIITGPGSDVAADPCWGLPKNLRAAMTVEEKDGFGCRCLGSQVFDPDSCTFPGLGALAGPAVLQPVPEPLAPLSEPPPDPVLPALPEKPVDPNDNVALAEFLSQLETYQRQVEAIQADYQAQVADYQSAAEQYALDKFSYEQTQLQWQVANIALISQAEALIASGYDAHGWVFVDRSDTIWYWRRLINTWRAQLIIIAVLFAGTLVMLRRKDRV